MYIYIHYMYIFNSLYIISNLILDWIMSRIYIKYNIQYNKYIHTDKRLHCSGLRDQPSVQDPSSRIMSKACGARRWIAANPSCLDLKTQQIASEMSCNDINHLPTLQTCDCFSEISAKAGEGPSYKLTMLAKKTLPGLYAAILIASVA